MPPTKIRKRVLALDTETTGLDAKHGCAPFFVSTCLNGEPPVFWEWHVDPLTREVEVPDGDPEEIQAFIDSADELVLHNAKFDVHALSTVIPNLRWPWLKTYDTIIAAHLLGSNLPKNLTDLAMDWLGVDISPQERALERAVKECRKVVQLARGRVKRFNEKAGKSLFEETEVRGIESFDEWRIGEDDDPMLPSGGGWGADYWLPRAMAKHQMLDEDEEYWHVLREYANLDSQVTIALWARMKEEILRHDLWEHFEEGRKVQRVVFEMEKRPVTINKARTAELKTQYQASSAKSHATCVALSEGTITKLPVNGRSNALNDVVFGKFGLKSSKLTKKGNESMDKYVLDEWIATLEEGSPAWEFITNLKKYRKRQTALSFIEAYEKFWISHEDYLDWANLYMSLNQTGTDTLRFTMSNPNGQQISKQEIYEDGQEGHSARYMFGPAPGREWWSIDYENIELRIPAYVAGEDLMVDLFERPDDPPYYGSYHLLIFDLLHPEKFAKHGVASKEVYSDTWYGWTKNGNFACVPMSTEALTRDGFKPYEELSVGDDVLGYDKGVLKWTPIRKKFLMSDAPLMEIANNHFKAVTTPDHMWVAKKRTGRGRTRRHVDYFVQTRDVVKETTIKLSAVVSDESRLNITNEEAEIIGFAYSDGSITKSKKGHGPSRGANGDKIGFSVRLFQKKQDGIDYIEDLLSRWGGDYRKHIRASGIHVYVISPAMARDMWNRANLWESSDFEQFVLDLGTDQRKAFLDSIYVAEGFIDARKNTRIFAQNRGKFAKGISLAVFMNGGWPTTQVCKTTYDTPHTQLNIRDGKPYVTGQRLVKTALEGKHQVWCVQTDLNSWVMRQGEMISLTGNCQYGAVAESGTADRAYHVPGAQRIIESRLTKIKALSQKMIAYANKTGYVETLPDKTTGNKRGYPLLCSRTARGGVLPTVPLSYMIQGSAMGCTRRAMIRCWDQCKQWTTKEKKLYRIPLQVHDEILFDFPLGGAKNIPKILRMKELMEESGADIGIPLKASVKYNPVSWDKGIKLSEVK